MIVPTLYTGQVGKSLKVYILLLRQGEIPEHIMQNIYLFG